MQDETVDNSYAKATNAYTSCQRELYKIIDPREAQQISLYMAEMYRASVELYNRYLQDIELQTQPQPCVSYPQNPVPMMGPPTYSHLPPGPYRRVDGDESAEDLLRGIKHLLEDIHSSIRA